MDKKAMVVISLIPSLAATVAGFIYLWNFVAVTPDQFDQHEKKFEQHVKDASEELAILVSNDKEFCKKQAQSEIDRINNLLLEVTLKKLEASSEQLSILLRYEADLKNQVVRIVQDKERCG